MKAYIKAIEYYLPEITEENTNARLRKKTGIERRHICPQNMTAGDMAAIAAEKLFEHGLDRSSIDFLLLCRLMLSDSGYASALMEGNILLSDYLYEFVDVMYAHVGIHNKKALRWIS